MIIAQISDTHLIVDGPGNERRIADFRTVISDIDQLNPLPDLIVHTGDIVHNGSPEEYAAAAQILDASSIPVYVLAGNKDHRENLRNAFSEKGYLPGETEFVSYSIDDFPVRLVMLDTLNPSSNKGDFCGSRYAQLDDLLSQGSSMPTAVFMHHPPFEVLVGPERFHFDDRKVMERLSGVIDGFGTVAGVFSGHVHRLTTGSTGTVPTVVTTSVATELRYGDYPDIAADRPIYMLHRFDPENGFRSETRFAGKAACSTSA